MHQKGDIAYRLVLGIFNQKFLVGGMDEKIDINQQKADQRYSRIKYRLQDSGFQHRTPQQRLC